MHALIRGVLAGAVGTVALNAVTYADMLLRGRPASPVPAEVAETLADRAGVELGGDDAAGNRQQAVGALFGYATGLGVAVVYSLAARRVRRLPPWVAAPVLGVAAMVGSDAPATALGVTEPAKWSRADWLADVIPHLAYGTVTAAVHKALE
ncbi:hypothetical protein GCM10027447_14780 [Glycomyces halotolerans]